MREDTLTRTKFSAAAMVVIGVVVVFVGLAISAQNVGMCPVGIVNCDHYYPGTGILIGATGNEISIVGGVLTIIGIVILARQQVNGKRKGFAGSTLSR